jgi:tetratricopeptide (TPR) repeat protein
MPPARRPPTALTALLTLVLLAGARSARADARDVARERSAAGAAAYNLGHYDEAASHYEAAYRAVPDPILLFDLGQCYRLGGRPEDALVSYRSYLRTAPADAPNREQVTRRIQELERMVAARRQTPGQSGARVPSVSPHPVPIYVRGQTPAEREEPAVYQKGWFWGAVGATVAAGVIAAFVLGRHTQAPVRGDVDPGVVVVR